MMNRRDERYGYEQHGLREGQGRDDWREREDRQRDFAGRERSWEGESGARDDVARRMRMNESMRSALYRGQPQGQPQGQSYGREQDMEQGWGRDAWREQQGPYGRFAERPEGFDPRGFSGGAWGGESYGMGRSGQGGGQGVTGARMGSTWVGEGYEGMSGSSERIGSGQGSMLHRSGGGYGFSGGSQGSQSYRGRGPRGFRRSDERLREQVCEVLSDHDEIDASEMEVVVKDGEVILTGIVEERRMKYLAEQAADSVPGVMEVQNNLRVRRPQEVMPTTSDRTGRNASTTASSSTQQPRGSH